jgi:PAS domain S-box-containing protein
MQVKTMVDLTQLIDALPHLVWTADAAGRVEAVNRRWREYTGLSLNAVVGQGWQSAVHAADRPVLLARWRSCLDSGQPCELQARLCRCDGDVRWFRFRVSPMREESGAITGWVGSAAEIEDPDLRSIIDAIPTMAWTADADGQCDFLNQRWLDYAGMTAAQAMGSGWAAAIHPADRERIFEYWQGCLASGTSVATEARLRRYDGAYRWFLFLANPLRDAAGKITKWYGSNLDIEDRKQAEEALLSNERNLRLIVNMIPAYINVLAADGSTLYANQAVLDYHGTTLEDVCNDYRNRFFHPEDIARLNPQRREALSRPVPFELEQRVRGKNGAYRCFLIRYSPLIDALGNVERWYVAATDIEDRKRTEAQLEQAYIRLTEAQRLSKTGSFVTDLLADDHNWSDEAFRIFEFDPAARLSVQIIRDLVCAEDLPAFDAGIERSRNGAEFNLVFRIRTPRGTVKYVQVHAHVVRQVEGRPLFIGALQDVTQHKIAEAELRRAHDELAEAQRLSRTGSFTTDLSSDEHTWSDELYRIFELDPGTRITLQRIEGLMHPEDRQLFSVELERAMAGHAFDFEWRIITAKGVVKYLHVVGHRVEEITDRPVVVGAAQDVTAVRVAENALNTARAELAHVSRVMTLGTLAASIAHEVNQPLAGIITNATTCLRMLAAAPPNLEGARATTQRTLRDGNRASETIQRLRSLYSQKQPKYEVVDLNDAAGEVLALSMTELQRAHVTLRTDYQQGLPTINGDRIQLQQVLLNLILNAADAMREVNDRPRDLLIATALQEPDMVRVSVCDSGIGIEPQLLEKIFDSFYTTKSAGMGMGLSISRSIIQNHQGRLWAKANEGHGATFAFCIPCEQSQPSTALLSGSAS